mmetsp:Transcript_38293/g.110601  ORF Transcript_38293/g.110601 Transcript_38293/m.110601 type:complete len:324 (-) Transcript_38293:1623-2594(-)
MARVRGRHRHAVERLHAAQRELRRTRCARVPEGRLLLRVVGRGVGCCALQERGRGRGKGLVLGGLGFLWHHPGAHERVMGSLLDLPAVVHYHNLVTVLDGREPVRDDESGALLGEHVQRPLHQALVLGVEGGRGLVKQDDVGFADDGACDSDALPLAAREVGAPHLHCRHELVRLLLQEVPARSVAAGLLYLLVSHVSHAICDVLSHTRGKEDSELVHNDYARTEVSDVILPDVLPVDADGTLLRLVEPLEQAHGAALPAACVPDQRHLLPRLHSEAQALEHLLPRVLRVGKFYIFEFDEATEALRPEAHRVIAFGLNPWVRL